MTISRRGMTGLAMVAVAAWLPVYSQSAAGDASAPGGLRIVAAYPEAAADPAGEVAREINDPYTGDRWALVRNPVHRGDQDGWCSWQDRERGFQASAQETRDSQPQRPQTGRHFAP